MLRRFARFRWTGVAIMVAACPILQNTAEAELSFEPRIDYATGDFPASVAIWDLHGDTELDLAVADSGSDKASVLLHR